MSSSETASSIKKLLKQKPDNEKEDAFRLDELRRIFAKLITDGDLIKTDAKSAPPPSKKTKKQDNPVKKQWNEWLQNQHTKFINQLCARVRSGRRHAVRTFFGVIASFPVTADAEDEEAIPCMDSELVYKLIQSVCSMKADHDAKEAIFRMLDQEFIRVYRDVQYFALMAIKRFSADMEEEEEDEVDVTEDIIRVLMMVEIAESQEDLTRGTFLIQPPPHLLEQPPSTSSDDESDDSDNESHSSSDEPTPSKKRPPPPPPKLHNHTSFSRHRNALGEAWLNTLRLPELTPSLHKRTLDFLPKHVMSKMHHPIRLADYFTQSYKIGGLTSILSLYGLFTLMTEYQLEYPNFYSSLYALVKTPILYSKHRSKFLELLGICLLKSKLLPAYLVAAFCKRLCRCALASPPSTALFVLALVSNLLRTHPQCACLIHRGGDEASISDPYDADTDDPSISQALSSSLWELDALSKHYHAAVSTLAQSCGTEDLKTTPMYDLDTFLMYTYTSLYEQEEKAAGRKNKKKSVPLTFKTPESVFESGDLFVDVLGCADF